MASGVHVSDECKLVFQDIQKHKKYRYIVLVIKDDAEIQVEKIGERSESYDDFTHEITKNGQSNCRYGVFDYEYAHSVQGASEPIMKNKIFCMSWCPDTAKIKDKMLYSSSFDALKHALVGVCKYIQATDLSEMSSEEVENQLRKTDRS